ncbi:hypothetical protein A2363_01775 [Candidatus Gottesmanbacteria bacterium RIFOXYB1_FULL_47_11]|uniref:Beta-lactamase class A catalytic domain-containing protein n=1 Tax=Candidatus Gottesmanbacteria bacterium RIFOXYB1_FULL_47_11 TaxID=1798401 RepID=A0A1F6BDF6_9BACT|nr:MAG: hypothetical protein A2363_01775 [Candidatus Gottesmanbacteria bacterium RIFOXYB1_FULL_47_11]
MKSVRILLISGVALVGLYLLLNQLVKLERANSHVISPLTDATVTTSTVIPPVKDRSQANSERLKDVVDGALEGATGSYGIYIKNLKTGESYVSGEHNVFDSASLYKLWVMAVVYQKIQDEQFTEDQVLREDVFVLNQKFDIDPELAEKTEGVITFSVREALRQMITVSDNYAALLLTEKIGLSSVATFLKENDLTESAVGTTGGPPTSTPYDIERFLEKLYREDVANPKYTAEMIDLLKNQKLNNGIPKYLPDASSVANKTGEIDRFKHDAGIIYTDNGDYSIVVMSESAYPPGAQERIARVSKAVFDYFTHK